MKSVTSVTKAFGERHDIIMQIADDMAAAAASMNSQNYEILIICRAKLKSHMDLWKEEDVKRSMSFDIIKSELEKIKFE